MGVSGRAVVVVYVNNGLVWQASRGEYSTGIFPSAAVDPVAVKDIWRFVRENEQYAIFSSNDVVRVGSSSSPHSA